MDDLTRLARAAQAGDRDALTAFVRRSQAEVWRYFASVAGRDAADDLTQEAYVRALGALPAFRGSASARTWLLSIARRTFVDSIRRSVRRRALLDRLQPGDAATVEPHGLVDLDDLVAALEPDRRSAFVLTQVLGLSYDEAAEVCDCPVGTIRSRVSRARRDLLVAMAEGGDELTLGAR